MLRVFLLILCALSVSLSDELERLIEFTLKNNPKIKAFENMKKSLKARSKFSLSLPNPRVDFAFNNFDTEGLFPRRENPMGSYAFFISQTYPLKIKRERTSEIFLQKINEVDKKKEIYIKELIRDIKILYWDFSYSFEIENILNDIKKEIEFLIDITEEKFRFGDALLSDLILLKVELLKVQEKLKEARRLRETSLARIYALAGGRIELKGSPLKKVGFVEEFSEEESVYVELLKEELKTIKKEIERAKVEHYPDLFFTGSYMIRPELPDLFTFRIGLTIPVWKKMREDLLVLEKMELYRAKKHEIENMKLKVRGEYEAYRSSYSIYEEILKIIEKEIKEKEFEIDTLLIAYRYEKTDIREILRAYRILWNLRFERARIIKEINQIVAKAEALL